VAQVLRQYMPASFGLPEFGDLGGMISNSANIAQINAWAADYVAKSSRAQSQLQVIPVGCLLPIRR
jgi:hypothetical protein